MLYFTYIDDVIADVVTQIPTENITIRSLSNMNNFYNIGINLNYTLKPLKWWTMITTANVFRNKYHDNISNDLPSALWTATFASQNNFSFGKGFSAELNAKYNTPEIKGLFRRKAFGEISAGMMKKIDNNLTLKFSVSDIFRTNNYKTTSNAGAVFMQQNFMLDSRVFNLSVSYNLGTSQGAKNNRKTGSEEVRERMKGS